MIITCTRRLEFDAAHRIKHHESKCKMLHGHRYIVEAVFGAKNLDLNGRIIDFGEVKKILGSWIDENWDHNTILCEDDKILGDSISSQTNQKIFYLKTPPTAENMALFLFTEICPKLFLKKDIKCVEIKIYETPNCYANVK